MRKADLVNKISDKTGVPKVDTLVVIESMIKEIKDSKLYLLYYYTNPF